MLVGGEERLSHTAPRVSPLLRCVGPIMKSSFLSQRNISGPLPRSSLCPPGPVSGTAAVSGAGGLGAGERPTCSGCSLLPSPSPASRPSLLAAHTSIHVFSPFAQVLWEHRERRMHVCSQLVPASWPVQGLCGALCFPMKPMPPMPALLIPRPTFPAMEGGSKMKGVLYKGP